MRLSTFILALAVSIGTLGADEEKVVYVVPIEGTIEKGLAAFINRVMAEAKSEAVSAVILEIDTPGGALDAALTIRDAILYSDVKTIAFINPRAISAGALISLASEHIVMVEGGTIGAATAVDMQGKKASEKVISYFRNEMKATAEKRGRSSKLAEAMVDEDVDVEDLAPKGKLLTLTTEEALEQKVADFKVSATDEGDKLQAVLELYELSNASIYHQSENWAEDLVRILTYPYLASLLMSLGFLGLIFEIQSPGWGVGGTIGILCLGLFFGSHLLVNLADWSEILIFVVGVFLVLADVFFIAGFGVLGAPGIVLMITGLFLSLIGRFDLWTWDSVGMATRPLLIAFVLTVAAAILMIRIMPSTNAWNWLVLQAEERSDEGYVAVFEYDTLLGTNGVALTPLRPGGTGIFDDRRISVATQGEFIEKDTLITVVEIEGTRILVRKADPV